MLFSREKRLWSDCSVKCWLHLYAPGLADFCKEKTDKIWHDPSSFPTGFFCLSPGTDLPSFTCLLLSPPERLPPNPSSPGCAGYLHPTLTRLLGPSPCPLFHPQVFPGSHHSAHSCTLIFYSVSEHVCVCICHMQRRRGRVCVFDI